MFWTCDLDAQPLGLHSGKVSAALYHMTEEGVMRSNGRRSRQGKSYPQRQARLAVQLRWTLLDGCLYYSSGDLGPILEVLAARFALSTPMLKVVAIPDSRTTEIDVPWWIPLRKICHLPCKIMPRIKPSSPIRQVCYLPGLMLAKLSRRRAAAAFNVT